jgi:hypothetical protein
MQMCRCADVQPCRRGAEEMQSTIRQKDPRAPWAHGRSCASVHQCILLLSWCAAIQPRPSIFPVSGASAQPRRPRLMRRPPRPLVNGRRRDTVAPACLLWSPPTPFSCCAATATWASSGTEPPPSPSQASPLLSCPPPRRLKRAWAVKASTAATVLPQPLAGY